VPRPCKAYEASPLQYPDPAARADGRLQAACAILKMQFGS